MPGSGGRPRVCCILANRKCDFTLARMLRRTLAPVVADRLQKSPVVALLGPRQVGKTTLARMVADDLTKASLYLDLERPSDRSKLADAELFLRGQARKLTILDEAQRLPGLFNTLRSLVDERIRAGERSCQFLVLGSASRDLMRQSAESLAGLITYLELCPLGALARSARAGASSMSTGYGSAAGSQSSLAKTDADSFLWREQFVRTYLERDLPQLGLRVSPESHRRLWSMLAHGQGTPLNARLASGLGVSGPTVRHHIDVLTELFRPAPTGPLVGQQHEATREGPQGLRARCRPRPSARWHPRPRHPARPPALRTVVGGLCTRVRR